MMVRGLWFASLKLLDTDSACEKDNRRDGSSSIGGKSSTHTHTHGVVLAKALQVDWKFFNVTFCIIYRVSENC